MDNMFLVQQITIVISIVVTGVAGAYTFYRANKGSK